MPKRRAFTLIELLVVVAIIVALLAILLPSMGKAVAIAQQTACTSNLRQQQVAFMGYMVDSKMIFPAHRDFNYDQFLPVDLKTPDQAGEDVDDFWASAVYRYASDVDVFRCSALDGPRTDYGVTWQWAFERNHIGYGYNAYFLGLWSHATNVDLTPALSSWMSTTQWFSLTRVRNPSECMLVADSNPIPATDYWSATLWWPKAADPDWEGVNTFRHVDAGGIAFNDGHAEARRHEDINPPTSPRTTGDDRNIRYWDPLQRNNPAF